MAYIYIIIISIVIVTTFLTIFNKINFHTKHIGTKKNVNLNILVAKNRALIIRLQENLAYVQKTSEEKNIMNL